MYGSVRGAEGNLRPYRDPWFPVAARRARGSGPHWGRSTVPVGRAWVCSRGCSRSRRLLPASRSQLTHLEAVSRNRRSARDPPGAKVVRFVVAPLLGRVGCGCIEDTRVVGIVTSIQGAGNDWRDNRPYRRRKSRPPSGAPRLRERLSWFPGVGLTPPWPTPPGTGPPPWRNPRRFHVSHRPNPPHLARRRGSPPDRPGSCWSPPLGRRACRTGRRALT